MRIRVINGPNLNRLGLREPHIYGTRTYRDLEAFIEKRANEIGVYVEVLQTNHEGTFIDWIHEDANFDALIVNPGAYSHTSIAIMDALLSIDVPIIEVHLTNIHARESYRRQVYSGQAALGILSGLGFEGYGMALKYLSELE